jgi:enamine deaminase RidA (YjgF/YER057c/UK114 family)
MNAKPIVPPSFGKPMGLYSYGVVAPGGELVVVAGQVGTDAKGLVAGQDIGAQTRKAFENVAAVLEAGGCGFGSVVRFQTFLTSTADVDGFMAARREVFATAYPEGVYPPNTLVVVTALVKPELRVEIEALAIR